MALLTPAAGPRPRRRPEAEVLDGLAAVGAATWNGLLTPGQGPLTHGYLRAWEHVSLDGLRPRAVVAVMRRLRERLLMVRVYEIGGPAPLAFPFLHGPELTAAQAARLLLPRALGDAQRCGAEVVLAQDFAGGGGPCDGALAELGFIPVPTLPAAVLELGFASFDAYLDAMRAGYRGRARAVLERSGDRGWNTSRTSASWLRNWPGWRGRCSSGRMRRGARS